MLQGDWDKVQRKLSSIADQIETEAKQATAESLALIETTVLDHLKNQDLSWKPLSGKYADYKKQTRKASWRRKRKKAGLNVPRRLSEKTLIATAAMLQAITSYQQGSFACEVGVSRQKEYKGKDGIKIANIGAIHELGSRDGRIPKRALWEPTAEEVKERVLEKFKRVTEKLIDV